MAGRAAMMDTSGALSDIRATRGANNGMGISGDATSAIGGEGRRGASGHGSLDNPSYTRIDTQVVNNPMNGIANGGKTGYVSGDGRTF